MEKMTQEQKVLAAAGPQNVKAQQSSAATNAKVQAAAPAPRPTSRITQKLR
jgi:hypothetical protein